MRRHAYEGPRRPAAELATVFARWDGAGSEQTYICRVDGRQFRQPGEDNPCPSVVYVTPGPHVFEVEHRMGFRYGTYLLTFNTRAGSTYEVKSSVYDEKYARYVWREMPPGYVLTYKDAAPAHFAKGERPNRPVSPDDPD